jgi:hypothetical protein
LKLISGDKIMRPDKGDYNPYYSLYIEKVKTDNAVVAMEKSLAETKEFFNHLSDQEAGRPYAEEKWSYKETLGHLIDTERIMSYRALCIAREEKKSLPGFDQNYYVANGNFNNRGIKDLIEEFTSVRNSSIILFKSFSDEILQNRGIANENEVTVLAIGFIIAGHDQHHLGVLKNYFYKTV